MNYSNYIPIETKIKERKVHEKKRLYKGDPPSVEQVFEYCEYCNMLSHLRFRKLFFRDIEVSTSCCKRVLGYKSFPIGMKGRDQKAYLQWLND